MQAYGKSAPPEAPRLADEPLPADSEVDWNRAYEFARDRRDAERERLERIESKIAPILAGAIAALGLFIDKSSGWPDLLVACILLIPITMLLRAFRTTDYEDFPNLDALVQKYPWYPKTFVRSVVLGATTTIAKNSVTIDRKARALNHAMVVLVLSIIVIFCWRIGEASFNEQHLQPVGRTIPATTATATTDARRNPSHDNKGR